MRHISNIISFLLFSVVITAVSFNTLSAEILPVKLKTVVIDAGHGGKDPGAKRGKIYEKDITLAIALQLGEMISRNYPSVNVIYTRKSDKFVELNERANIANKNNADLFISIHVNSARNRTAMGHETFVMGTEKNNANMEVCQLENSVIVFEDDYTSKYSGFDPDNPESYIIFSLLQNSHLEQSLEFATCVQEKANDGPIYNNRGVKQANFLVLWKCTMPAVLIETGFISNPNNFKALILKSNQKKIASNIYKAFVKYKKNYDMKMEISEDKEIKIMAENSDTGAGNSDTLANSDTSAKNSGVTAKNIDDEKIEIAGIQLYGIQIFALSKLLKAKDLRFKGWDSKYIKKDKLYKYYIGEYSCMEEAEKDLKKIRKSFPDAFIIKID